MVVRKTPADRASRTKSDVDDAFLNVSERAAADEGLDPKAVETQKRQAETVRKTAKALSPESIGKEVASLGLEIRNSLSQIAEKVLTKANEFAEVQKAVELEKAEIERLYGVEIAAASLQNLIADHATKKSEFEAERTRTFEQWATEKDQKVKEQKDFDNQLNKQRQREAADYEYVKNAERKKTQDDFDEKMRLQDRAIKDKALELEKQWVDREHSLQAKEADYVNLQKQVADFPEVLKKEVAAQTAIVGNTMKRQSETDMQLLRKDMEGEQKANALQAAASAKLIESMQAQIDTLKTELAVKSQQVETIAVRAVDAASGRQALESLEKATQSRGDTGKQAK